MAFPIPEGPRLALLHFANYAPWFETVKALPKDRAGRQRSFRHTVGWLCSHGYAFRRRAPERPDGTRGFDQFVLTAKGENARARLKTAP